MGAKGCGKTNLLVGSQLSWLTSVNDCSQGLGAAVSSSYKFLFSNQAVFIESTSQATESPNDIIFSYRDPAWGAILKFLKLFRLFRPIQGVLVTISLPDLFLQREQERSEAKQQQLLRDITKLIRLQLSCNFPLYLVFTQCDRLAGFREFFSSTNNLTLEQPLGINFTKGKYKNPDDFNKFFKLEFDHLVNRINRILLARIENEKNIEIKKLISYFPHQIELFKTAIYSLLSSANYTQLRGIFFTSTTQTLETTDFVISELTRNYSIRTRSHQPIMQEKTFFVKHLVTQGILADRSGYESSLSSTKFLNFFKNHFKNLGVITVLILGFALWGSYCHNKIKLKEIQYYLTEYQQKLAILSEKTNSLASLVPLLDSA